MSDEEPKKLIDQILQDVDLSGFLVLAPEAEELYAGVVSSAGKRILLQAGIAEDEIDLYNHVNEIRV